MADRLRPLSAAQAANCENAREPVCRCRCGGAGHGKKRAPVGREDDRTFYEQLDESDPHHLPSDAERKHLKRQRRHVNQLAIYAAMWPLDHPERAAADARVKEAREELARIEAVVLGMRRDVTETATADGTSDDS